MRQRPGGVAVLFHFVLFSLGLFCFVLSVLCRFVLFCDVWLVICFEPCWLVTTVLFLDI